MDEADYAQVYEEQTRERALHNLQQKKQEAPLIFNGVRVCIDCEEEINTKRVKLLDAVRCQYCQSDHEKRSAHYG